MPVRQFVYVHTHTQGGGGMYYPHLTLSGGEEIPTFRIKDYKALIVEISPSSSMNDNIVRLFKRIWIPSQDLNHIIFVIDY